MDSRKLGNSVVYLPQIPLMRDKDNGKLVNRFDLTDAKRWGTICPLLDPFENPQNAEEIIDILHEKLQDYSDSDYIVAAGNPAILGWTVAICAYYNGGHVRMLQWSKQKREYEVVEAVLW